jgi:penicillin-binding protein 2
MPTDFPTQNAGLWPDEGYFDRTYGAGRWTRGYLVSLGIGQGNVAVTPMQLARYTAALANGGTLVAPHFARALRNPDTGEEVRPGLPRVERLPLDSAHVAVVREGMRAVVTNGTARIAQIEGVPVAGKTGTAQNPQGEDHSLFIAFAPYSPSGREAEIAVAVLVENAGFGSTAAAPIASLLVEQYLTGTVTRPELVRRIVEDVRSEPAR